MHVEITKNTNGVKKSCLAFQKLENGFIYMLNKKINDSKYSKGISVKFFEENAIEYLE